MGHLEGTDVHTLAKQHGKLSVDESLKIVIPIAEAPDYANQRGIVHRDVKSGSIICNKLGETSADGFWHCPRRSRHEADTAGTAFGTPEST